MKNVFNLLNTPSVKYVIIRYFTYIIQFANAILLLHFLGDYKYGVYSFVLLFLSYFSYANLGLNYSLNTLLSVYKNRKNLLQKIWSVCSTLNLMLACVIALINILVITIYPSIFEKYEYADYAMWMLLAGLLVNLNWLYVSVYRIYGKLWKINFQQLVPNFALFIVVLTLQKQLTIHEILYILVVTQAISLLTFMYKSPLSVSFSYHSLVAIVLVKRGIHLMLQSFSFSFITIAATTIVGVFYVAEDLGFYSLSNTIVNAIVLALGSFMFLLYPKMLNRFANSSISEIGLLLKRIRNIYILGADYIALLSLACIPVVYFFIPQYDGMFQSFKILTVSQIIFNGTMGYSQLLIARKLEHKMTIYGLFSVGVVFGCSLLIGSFKLPFYYIPFAVVTGITLYSYLILHKGISCLKKISCKEILEVLFNRAKIVSISFILVSFFFDENYIMPVLAFFIMLFMTRHKIVNMIKESSQILLNKDLLKI